jgi:hypothetical protein
MTRRKRIQRPSPPPLEQEQGGAGARRLNKRQTVTPLRITTQEQLNDLVESAVDRAILSRERQQEEVNSHLLKDIGDIERAVSAISASLYAIATYASITHSSNASARLAIKEFAEMIDSEIRYTLMPILVGSEVGPDPHRSAFARSLAGSCIVDAVQHAMSATEASEEDDGDDDPVSRVVGTEEDIFEEEEDYFGFR